MIGDTTVSESCCCDQWNGKPVTIRKGKIAESNQSESPIDISVKPTLVNCGNKVPLNPGIYTITAPSFSCSPATCQVSYTWTVTKKSVESESADIRVNNSGRGNSFGYNFNKPGEYIVTFTPQCGSCKCVPCKITVIINKK